MNWSVKALAQVCETLSFLSADVLNGPFGLQWFRCEKIVEQEIANGVKQERIAMVMRLGLRAEKKEKTLA